MSGAGGRVGEPTLVNEYSRSGSAGVMRWQRSSWAMREAVLTVHVS